MPPRDSTDENGCESMAAALRRPPRYATEQTMPRLRLPLSAATLHSDILTRRRYRQHWLSVLPIDFAVAVARRAPLI